MHAGRIIDVYTTQCAIYLDVKVLVHQYVFWLDVLVYDVSLREVHHRFQNL